MATAKNYIRQKGEKVMIWLRLSISGKQILRVSTGLYVNSDDFDTKKGLPKQNTPLNKKLNTDLKTLIIYVENQYNADFARGITFNNEWLKCKIKEHFRRPEDVINENDDNYFLTFLRNYNEVQKISGIAESTNSTNNVLLKKFAEYENVLKRKILISEIGSVFMLNFKKYLLNIGMMESTTNAYLRRMKTVLNSARDLHDKDVSKTLNGFRAQNKKSTSNIYLSIQEIEKIKNLKIIDEKTNHFRDWLILGCNIGQRASDLLTLEKDNIVRKRDVSGVEYDLIMTTQKKTGKTVAIPINKNAREIINKYGGNFPPKPAENLNSAIKTFSKYIKKLCEMANINEIVEGKIFNKDLGKNEIVMTEKYNIVSSHICRKSFATNYYADKRFTTAEIMSITGHTTETNFLTYIGKTNTDFALTTAKTFHEIENAI